MLSPERRWRQLPEITEDTIRKVLYDGIWYNSYVMRNEDFMSAQTQSHRLFRGKQLLKTLKHPEETGMIWRKKVRPVEWVGQIICHVGIYLMSLRLRGYPSDVPPAFCFSNSFSGDESWITRHATPFHSTWSSDAAGYTAASETVVKTCIDVLCDGRSHTFQQTASAHKSRVLKTKIWPISMIHLTPIITLVATPKFTWHVRHCWTGK